ncbi:MAG: hypothetical protein OXI05_06975, partial [Bacteroidota bacterium]|nr:hypothetical protein [Bacteroidota bacterium]
YSAQKINKSSKKTSQIYGKIVPPINRKGGNFRYNSAVKLADWAIRSQGLSPEIEEQGIDLEQACQTIRDTIQGSV